MRFYEQPEPSFFQKYRLFLVGGIVVALGIAALLGRRLFSHTTQSRSEQRMMLVSLPPPPPPPPPPVQTPVAPVEQRMITQDPVNEMEYKPDDTPSAEPPANDTAGLGTSIQGDGAADGFGLRANTRGGTGIGSTATRPRGSRWGWYAGQVQNSISQALRNNQQTKYAEYRVEARIWADKTGRVTRARLGQSTGNSALDNAITNEVLAGLILPEPPPDGMPMPIVLRLSARPPKLALSK